MSGKSAPSIEVSTQEIAAAFKRTGLPIEKYCGFARGYELGRALRAEELHIGEQLPVNNIEVVRG